MLFQWHQRDDFNIMETRWGFKWQKIDDAVHLNHSISSSKKSISELVDFGIQAFILRFIENSVRYLHCIEPIFEIRIGLNFQISESEAQLMELEQLIKFNSSLRTNLTQNWFHWKLCWKFCKLWLFLELKIKFLSCQFKLFRWMFFTVVRLSAIKYDYLSVALGDMSKCFVRNSFRGCEKFFFSSLSAVKLFVFLHSFMS